MNLETKIDERIWRTIETNYKTSQYTNAILDAIYFLSDLIREKTGLETDGVSLVGQAFGGKNPKLKVNNLQTESDWNVQKGIEQLLRGLYQSIRNPRSHEKFEDTKDDTDSIIVFIDYLIKVIDKSKTPFTKNEFMERVLDPDFVKKELYAELLVKKIPPKYRFDIMIEVFRQKSDENRDKLAYSVQSLLKKLTKEETEQLFRIVSEELRVTREQETIRCVIAIFPGNFWQHIDETAKLRMENKLIQSITDGRYDSDRERLIEGALGTWATGLVPYMVLKDEFFNTLLRKLNSYENTQQDYIFEYLFECLLYIESDVHFSTAKNTVIKNLKNGDIRFYNECYRLINSKSKKWRDALNEAYENFEERDQTFDDVPF